MRLVAAIVVLARTSAVALPSIPAQTGDDIGSVGVRDDASGSAVAWTLVTLP
jgi:hypothetical protein